MYRFKKGVILLSYVLLIYSCKKDVVPETPVAIVQTPKEEPHLLTPVTFQINSTIGGFYAGIPFKYNEGDKKYPLLIFLPGGGQFGNGKNDLPLLLNDGLVQILDEKKFPTTFNINNQPLSFIILTPQFTRYPSTEEIKDFVDYALTHYRIDTTRIYLSGLSMGGTVTCDVAAAYSTIFAAIVPISGVSSNDIKKKTEKMALQHLPVWIFHNNNDPITNVESPKLFFGSLNDLKTSPAAKLTIFNSNKHDAWTKAIDPFYKENGLNIYEWMLQYKK